jgi:hypothetical protein
MLTSVRYLETAPVIVKKSLRLSVNWVGKGSIHGKSKNISPCHHAPRPAAPTLSRAESGRGENKWPERQADYTAPSRAEDRS